MKEGHHKVKVETVLGPIAELVESLGDGGEDIPALLTRADAVGEVVHLAEGEGVGHAEGFRAVVEIGEDVDILAREGLGKERLVDAVEGARGERARGLLVENLLGEVPALGGGGVRGAGHVDGYGLSERVAVAHLDGDLTGHAGGNAGVNNGLLHPVAVLLLGLVNTVNQGLVNGFTSSHQAVAKVRVLVQGELTTSERELVLVVALSKLLGHATMSSLLESRLEDNLSGTTAKVENGGSGALIRTANLTKEVVGSDPSVDTLVRSIHDVDTVVLLGDNGERVLGLQMGANRIENLLRALGTNHAKTSGRLYGNGAAGLELIGNSAHGNLHKGVKSVSSGLGVVLILAEAADLFLGHLELLVLELGGRTAVVELVDVDSGSSATGVDHQDILDDGLILGAGARASIRSVRRVGGDLALGVSGPGTGDG